MFGKNMCVFNKLEDKNLNLKYDFEDTSNPTNIHVA